MADKALGGLRGPPPQLLPLHSPSLCSILTGPTFIPALPLAWNHLSVAVPTLCFPTSCKSAQCLCITEAFPNHPVRSSPFHFLLPLPSFVFLTSIATPTINTHTHTHTTDVLPLVSPTTMHAPGRQAFWLFCSQLDH